MLEEHAYTCPFCWQTISTLVDPSVEGAQGYVEDCEVCCRPIQLTVTVEAGEIVAFDAAPAQDA